MEDIVVAVVGGCGFLGQHIIRELQAWNNKQEEGRRKCSIISNERPRHFSVNLNSDDSEDTGICMDSNDVELLKKDDFENCNINIKEIIVLDIKPLEPSLDFSENPPISMRYCDIRLESQISEELEGVNVVFHCAASTLSLGKTNKNKQNEEVFWETNLEGTENVIWACRKMNVKILIYTSTVGAVMGGKKLVSHTETLTPAVDETKLLLGTYARSRKRAEDIVLNAHKTPTANDDQLLTTVLRPVALFGEGDTQFIPSFIDMAKKAGGKLPPLGSPFAYHQLTYAGNAAVAHVCAMIQLLNKSTHPLRDCGGLPTYVCDDSPIGTSDQVLRPFLNNFGLSTTPPSFPFFVVMVFTLIIGFWASFWKKVGRPCRWESALPSVQLQSLAGTTTVVSRTRAELTLCFKPKYTWEQSIQATLPYYEKLIEQKVMKSLEY